MRKDGYAMYIDYYAKGRRPDLVHINILSIYSGETCSTYLILIFVFAGSSIAL